MRSVLCCLLVLFVLFALLALPPVLAGEPTYGDPFWKHWGDGKAEMAGYTIRYPRYGEIRHGTAVTIFVTETFSISDRVKADPGRHPESDEVPVMKLNLVEDFSTGIYDYNMMTSTFVALEPFAGVPRGNPMKVSFSTQEWCGHIYAQLLFDRDAIRLTSHSYFDGEADQERTLERRTGAFSEDTLLHWARGFAAPTLKPGEERDVPIVRSLAHSRLHHEPVAWRMARLFRSKESLTIEVPAGTFVVDERIVAIDEHGPKWRFYVEKDPPHRLIRWKSSKGHHAELQASTRLAYWGMSEDTYRSAVKNLGLKPRPALTP